MATEATVTPIKNNESVLDFQCKKMEDAITRSQLFLKLAISHDDDLKSKGFKKGLRNSKKQISRFVKAFYAAWAEMAKCLPEGSEESKAIFEACQPLENFAPALEAHAEMLAKAEWKGVDKYGVENAFFYLLDDLETKFSDFYSFVSAHKTAQKVKSVLS